jgi:ABC-type dipeptide/oligopeptide/nickel transport system permease subunit
MTTSTWMNAAAEPAVSANVRVLAPPASQPTSRTLPVALIIGLAIVGVLILLAVLAPAIAPYDMARIAPADRLQAPSAAHWFGTDAFGRDLFSRVLVGARLSLTVALLAVIIGGVPGILLGLLAGMYPGLAENLLTRMMDAWMAVPSLLLAIVIAAAFGRTTLVIALALGVAGVPTYYRLTRAETLRVREALFVEAARSVGCRESHIMLYHTLPGVLPSLLVLISHRAGAMLLAASALGFIGLGAQPPAPEWGALITEGRDHFHQAWWLMSFPGVAITLTVLGFNLLGDGLRDMLRLQS